MVKKVLSVNVRKSSENGQIPFCCFVVIDWLLVGYVFGMALVNYNIQYKIMKKLC